MVSCRVGATCDIDGRDGTGRVGSFEVEAQQPHCKLQKDGSRKSASSPQRVPIGWPVRDSGRQEVYLQVFGPRMRNSIYQIEMNSCNGTD
jgi:hypothetical protein